MSIDKFGRSAISTRPKILQQRRHQYYKITVKGDIDWENRRLTNVEYPEEENDCATKKFVSDRLFKTFTDLHDELERIRSSHSLMMEQIDSMMMLLDVLNKRMLSRKIKPTAKV